MDRSSSEELFPKKELEKLSSAFTLSDMEIFIFPELFYPLVLADIMSPVLWKWRDDPWFDGIGSKGFNWKANRIKQFIIQNYVFNLDLATWGLTTKQKEIARFSDFFDIKVLRQSNALFGYEGDKYYFDIDIRKHFGLDKFNTDTIPYWKTETIEAMGAFRHKEGFSTGAGECVSLSALYAAAMFVVGRIPLEKIFLIATPLHSQNFIIEKEGLITNNRRIVTKNMWFNGTSLSEKARRALENEKVTIVSHISGHIHAIYSDATIDPEAYQLFSRKLRDFLVTGLTDIVFINFLRFKSKYKKIFQFMCECSGSSRYISLEKMFEYEHSSKHTVAPGSRESLVCEIEGDEFHLSPIQDLLILNDYEAIIKAAADKPLSEIEEAFRDAAGREYHEVISEMFVDLARFTGTAPLLPDRTRNYLSNGRLSIGTEDSRDDIINHIVQNRETSETARLALYVFRRMDLIEWKPFVKAAIERNPVSFDYLGEKSIPEIYKVLGSLPDESIYEGPRLALPDEVWNFRRGDGIEKALLMAGVISNRDGSSAIVIETRGGRAKLTYAGKDYDFVSKKGFSRRITISGTDYTID